MACGSLRQDLEAVYAAMGEPLRLIASELRLPSLPVETVPPESDVEAWLAYDYASVQQETKVRLLSALGVSD